MILASTYVLYPDLLLQFIVYFGNEEMLSDIEQKSEVWV